MVTMMRSHLVQGFNMRNVGVGLTGIRQAIVAAALLMLVPMLAFAATRGPDAGGYIATDEALYSFVDLSGASGGAGVLADTDEGTAVLTLPFPFQFYGQSYTLVCVSSNGALYFITNIEACAGIVDFANTDLTNTSPPGGATAPNGLPAVLPFWSDLTFQVPGAGSVIYQTIGAVGSRKFIVQWSDAHPAESAGAVTFQLLLAEGTNRILFQYRNVDLGNGNPATKGGNATIGIRNSGAVATGQQIQWSSNASVVNNESALLFTPPGLVTPTITWAEPASILYGTALDGTQLNAFVDALGTLTYDPLAGTILPIGSGQTLSVSFAPADPLAYAPVSASVTIDVTGAPLIVPTITWATPASIIYGTALGAAQLNATVNAPGTLIYSPPAGTALPVGSGQVLSVSFTPADPLAYSSANKTVTIDVTIPTLTVSTPGTAGRVQIGTQTPITWTTTGLATSFDVELSRDGGAFAPIRECRNLPASATSCTWRPTGPPASNSRVRVTLRVGPASSNAESGAFAIEAGPQ
jgi:hypothetical protein